MADKNIDISIVVTSHSEGILLHKTLQSIRRATRQLTDQNITHEILLHLDNPTPSTVAYIQTATILNNTTIFKNAFGDAGRSRNFCIQKAVGKYITFIDADDIMSKNWLRDAYTSLESHEYNQYVAHSELTVEFDELDSIVKKHGEINKDTDTLLSVWAGRWNSVIFAPTELLQTLGYPSNTKGYGYEDWLMSCQLIERGIHNILIPETVIFVRRKLIDSMWNLHRNSMAVLPATAILSFDNIRSIPNTWQPTTKKDTTVKDGLKSLLKEKISSTRLEKTGRRLYKFIQNIPSVASPSDIEHTVLPSWLVAEWKDIHTIERKLFAPVDAASSIKTYDTLTPEHYLVGEAYRQLIAYTHSHQYDYLLFVPWLIKGGADLFAVNYANSIAALRPDKKVAVIATLPHTDSVWRSKLTPEIDFIPFGAIAGELEPNCQNRLLEQFVENSHATHIHIFNSALAYAFVASHADYITGTNKKVIVTSFSQSTDETGRIFGYSHTHVPMVYGLADSITTDNQAVIDMWVDEYGFDKNKLFLHRQPMDIKNITPHTINEKNTQNQFKVLWAARLAPEKVPQLVPEIARLVQPHGITIDMYGTASDDFDTSFLKSTPSNLTYRGAFDDFYALQPESFDAFLYTSLFDGMPNALLEASAVGLPIVSSAVGGIPEFIDNEKGGLLITDVMNASDYANKLISLSKDSQLQSSVAEFSRRHIIRDFSSHAHRDAIDTMLKRVDY